MRIVFVARAYWPAVGGVESFVRLLARALGSTHELTVIAQRADTGESTRLTDSLQPPPEFEPFRDESVTVKQFRVPPSRRLLLTPLIHQIVPGLRRYAFGRSRIAAAEFFARVTAPLLHEELQAADVVHVFGGDLIKGAALRAAHAVGVPAVITPFVHPGQWGDDPASARFYRQADKVIGLLEADARICRQLGVADERLAVCGVCSPALPVGGGVGIRRRLGLAGPVILFLGARRAYKGVDLLLRSAEIVARSRRDVTFVFAGPGASLRSGDHAAQVLDVGMVDEDDRAAWLEAADVLCLPSAAEIFPVSFLEAWSVGTPVLSSDIPPLVELTDRSGGGIAVRRDPDALAGAIIDLCDDPAAARRLGAAGKRFWEAGHTPTAVAEWHERLYADLARWADRPPLAVTRG